MKENVSGCFFSEHSVVSYWRLQSFIPCNNFFFLDFILLTERCRTDDLLPDLPVPCLPPRCVHSKVLGLNVIVDRSQPGGSWTPHGSPPVTWRSQCGEDDTVMVFLLSSPSQVPEEFQPRAFCPFIDWRTACDAPNCLICSVPGVWFS